MKLKVAEKSLKILNEYFENQGNLSFDIAEKICDIVPILEEQIEKYNKLFGKFLKDNYDFTTDEQGKDLYQIKDLSKLEFVQSEKLKIDSLEFVPEKQNLHKPKEIPPKVFMVLKEFFLFE